MNSARLFLLLLAIAGVIVGAWVWNNQRVKTLADKEYREAVEQGFLSTRKQFNDKLEDIRQRREEIVVQIARLEERKSQTGQKLKDMGIATADDLEKNELAKLEFSNLKRLMADVDKFRQDVVVYDEAIGRIQAALDDLERQELKDNAGIDDRQSRQLNTIIRDIDDRLIEETSPVEQLETQKILDDILGKEPVGSNQ